MTWAALTEGDSIPLAPGQLYAVVASVKANHSAADIRKIAEGKGLAIQDYAEQGQRTGLGPDPRSPDYRYVAAIALARTSASLPWGVPWPLSMADDSHLVRAWTSPIGPLAPPPAPAPAPDRTPPSMVPLAVIGAAGALLWLWRGRKARPYALGAPWRARK